MAQYAWLLASAPEKNIVPVASMFAAIPNLHKAAERRLHMKLATTIARILLGFIYLVFGLDYYFQFIPYQPMHTGNAAAFKAGLVASGYFYPMIKSMQIVGGIALMVNRYAPFFAVVLFPISINVLLFHTVLVPSGWLMGVFLVVPNLFLGYAYRKYYSGMFVRKPII